MKKAIPLSTNKQDLKRANTIKALAVLLSNKLKLGVLDLTLIEHLKKKTKVNRQECKGIDALFGSWSKEEAERFNKVIQNHNHTYDENIR